MGDPKVGKNSLRAHLVGDDFTARPAHQYDILSKVVYDRGQSLQLRLLNPGRKRDGTIESRTFYRFCHAIIILYDITYLDSFKRAGYRAHGNLRSF